MAIPTREQLEKFAAGYVRLWNEGDKEAWKQNWLDVAPGDFTMWDPVGTPPKHGFEHCALDSFDLFQPRIRFHTPKETIFFNPGHLAWVMQNQHERDDKIAASNSIETYAFGEDGSVVIRTYYPVPSHEDEALGDLFQTYLPGQRDGA